MRRLCLLCPILTPVDTLSGEKARDDDPTPLCARCVRASGLCVRCARQIAKLAEPFWYKLVGTHYQQSAVEQMSPEARRVFNRKRTKEARRAARAATMQGARARSLASLTAA